MTKRLAYPAAWAQNGQAVDPDLDTTHLSYEANRYATKGWHSEKPPEQWQNFLSQISDMKIISLLVDGIQQWDSGVTYQVGALSKVAGVSYIRVSVVTPVKSPELSGSGWDKLVDPTALGFNNLVQGLIDKLSAHNAASNPHADDIHNVIGGGYIKSEVDSKFASATDPKTIVYHMGQAGQTVHGETVAQIGTLSAALGGTFSGPVIFEEDAIIQISPSMVVHLNQATALLEMASGTVSLGVAANGVGYVVTVDGMFVVMSEANYAQLNNVQNGQFALPTPLLSMDFFNSMNDVEAIGNWILDSDNPPVFSATGALGLGSNPIRFSKGIDIRVPLTVLCVGVNASGTSVYSLQDKVDFTVGPGISTTLNTYISVNMGIPGMTHLKRLLMYPRLSANQKTMLAVN